MIKIKSSQQLKKVRRLALAAQGLTQAQRFGSGLVGTRKAINHIGYVQLDSISVIERAHHHVLHTRVPGFKPAMVDQLLSQTDIFEYWSHAAALLPINDFRFTLPYKHAIKSGQTHWFKNPDQKLMAELLHRIRIDGPLRAREVTDQYIPKSNSTSKATWWDWKPAKKALEQLYMQGDLMVSKREGFQKTYDLTERVLPNQCNTQLPNTAEFAEHLLNQQLRCHALISLKGLTYLRRNVELRQTMKALVQSKLSQGTLQQVQLPNQTMFLVKQGTLEEPLPRRHDRLVIVSPFDNSVIQRDRLKALYEFDYQIECYVPAAKRRYGYFSLPLLYRDTFIGRMDCKAHRQERLFAINSLHIEAHDFDLETLCHALFTALKDFIKFQACDRITLGQVSPKYLKAALQNHLNIWND